MKKTHSPRFRTCPVPAAALLLTILCGALATARAGSTPPPQITGFSPHIGPVGSTVIIDGTNFVAPISIIFGGDTLAEGSFTSTRITTTVPSGAQTGPIRLQTAGGTVLTATNFVIGPSDDPKVTLDVAIPSVKERSGKIGEFTVHLSKSVSKNTVIAYGIKGTAINGTNYKLLLGTVTVAAGTLEKPIKIVPKGNLGGAPVKTVKLHLEDGAGYIVDSNAPKVVQILP